MNNLYEALEICLQELEQGADMETVLFRYPDLADELRPILEASAGAKSMAAPLPSVEVVRRNRAKVLQHAAQMRESKVKSSQRIWFASLRRIAVTLAVVAALFVSGTGLVRAASATLPGDNLYPVKRTWEDMLLLFTFNLQDRELLEIEHENERLHELMELFAKGLSAEVDFAGTVTSQSGNEWIVNGVRVVISEQTEVREGPITIGSAVRVRGLTQGKGIVLAERIRVLSSEEKLPDVEYQDEDDDGNENEGSNHPSEDNSGPGSGNESSSVEETETPESNSGSGDESSNSGSDSDNSGSEDGSNENNDNSRRDNNDNSSDDNSGSDNGSNDNSNDDGSNDSNSNDNGDDSGGGGDNSGSGSGGSDGEQD
jgi:uncharacterized membrane protein YgcG